MRAATERYGSAAKVVLLPFLAIAAFFLLMEHRAHVLGALPYALVLLCPILHLFHGHGSHGHGAPHEPQGEHAAAHKP